MRQHQFDSLSKSRTNFDRNDLSGHKLVNPSIQSIQILRTLRQLIDERADLAQDVPIGNYARKALVVVNDGQVMESICVQYFLGLFQLVVHIYGNDIERA